MRYEKNEKLLRLIENKRVALVGPAQYLVGKNLGKILNEYDVVCRVNYMAPSKFISDYGNRTDIMFYNCSTASIHQMKQHFNEYPDFSKGMKLVVCPVVKVLGPEKWEKWGMDFISPTVANFNSINTFNMDFHWIGMRNYRYLFDLIKCVEPNTGVLAMLIILEYSPKEFFTTGFTFYATIHDTYFEGYATRAPGWNGYSGHPQGRQIEFFKEYILSKGVKVDSYLNSLLKLNHNNIHKL